MNHLLPSDVTQDRAQILSHPALQPDGETARVVPGNREGPDSGQLLEFFFEDLPGMAYHCLTDLNWTMEFVSAGCTELTGWPPASLIGNAETCYESLIHPADRQQVRDCIEQALAQGKRFEIEYRILRADGTEKWVCQKGGEIFSAQGRPLTIAGLILDISTLKQVQQELNLRSQDLERANRELDRFIYMASHDLQEPLRTLTSYLQLLSRRYRSQLDSSANDFIQYAVSSAARMQRLINDLLTYSRLSSRPAPFAFLSLERVLHQVLANLQPQIEETQAAIDCETMPVIFGDELQMGLLFHNLLSNALKFRGPRPLSIAVKAQKKGPKWIIAVSDNGIGIEERFFERIFIVFQRLHNEDEIPGTGIGLPICKKIVEHHRGSIWLESQPGAGSTFYFSLPVITPDQENGG